MGWAPADDAVMLRAVDEGPERGAETKPAGLYRFSARELFECMAVCGGDLKWCDRQRVRGGVEGVYPVINVVSQEMSGGTC